MDLWQISLYSIIIPEVNKTVAIVIPAYKERDNIAPLVERIHQALHNYSYRILFVDDDSGDGTAELVAALSAKYPLDILVRKNKRGLASAVVDGLQQATGEVIVVMDADLQHPPEVLSGLLKKIGEGADMAIASRYVPGGSCQGWGLARRINSKGAIFIAHLLLPPTRRIKDPMSGFFAFTRQAIAGADLKPAGYKIILEILMLGKFQNVAEVPYTFSLRSRGHSKLSARQQVEYLKHVYSLMKRSGELVRFFKFCLVGASGILVNEGLLWLLTEFGGLVLQVSSAISIESSIIFNFILNDFFTCRDRHSKGAKAFLYRRVRVNVVSLAGLLLNLGLLWLFTGVFGDEYYLVYNLIGIALAFLLNYGINTLWTWR